MAGEEAVSGLTFISHLTYLTRNIAGFDVARTGVASVGFIGFPSVGKSTLMSKLTGQHSEGIILSHPKDTLSNPMKLLRMNSQHSRRSLDKYSTMELTYKCWTFPVNYHYRMNITS